MGRGLACRRRPGSSWPQASSSWSTPVSSCSWRTGGRSGGGHRRFFHGSCYRVVLRCLVVHQGVRLGCEVGDEGCFVLPQHGLHCWFSQNRNIYWMSLPSASGTVAASLLATLKATNCRVAACSAASCSGFSRPCRTGTATAPLATLTHLVVGLGQKGCPLPVFSAMASVPTARAGDIAL